MSDKLPALEGTTSSEIFAQHLNALHEARRAYIQTKANEHIRRALRTKVRAAEQIYQNGHTVFYKCKERWLGPASVVFQDGWLVGWFWVFGWLVGLGFNRPLKQYFSLYRAVYQRKGERGKKG